MSIGLNVAKFHAGHNVVWNMVINHDERRHVSEVMLVGEVVKL